MDSNYRNSRIGLGLLLAAFAIGSSFMAHPAKASEGLLLPPVQTHADGRAALEQLYQQYQSLQQQGWQVDIIGESRPPGRTYALPIIALRTPQSGKAVWILSGIHGEETAGPNAIAASIDALAELGKVRPVVLLPLNNPHGYANNWRYLNVAQYDENIDGQSVGDSSHLLPDPENPARARADRASSPEADAITRYILELRASYPPLISIDLHEDNLIDEGYVYSQGKKGAEDPLAALAVTVLRDNGVPLKMAGTTRFDEPIEAGIIGPVVDSSIDELMSADRVIVDGRAEAGPGAETVLVFETPAAAIPLRQRVQAHAAFLRALAAEFSFDESLQEP